MRCTCPEKTTTETYPEFDDVCFNELKTPILVHKIINQSKFCTNIPKGFLRNDSEDWVTVNDILSPIANKHGVYHLWHSEELLCNVHKSYKLQCLYVGKGVGDIRAKFHIKEKYPPEAQVLISFFECSNRIAKYLEQLFLDTYEFKLNGAENNKRGAPLYAYWNYARCQIGTETDRLAKLEATREMNRLNLR